MTNARLAVSPIQPRKTRRGGVVARVAIGIVALILIPPFVVLAIAPMLLVLTPVAFIAIPFMLSAFAGEAREVVAPPRRLQVLRPAVRR